MIGITIGIGGIWPEIAGRAARRMERMTGLPCVSVDQMPTAGPASECTHPSWLKCHLLDLFPEHDALFVFDADILCLRPWDPRGLFAALGEPFCAVPDRQLAPVMQECKHFGLPFPDWYVNGGLLMFARTHKPVWEATWARHPQYGSWLEQTGLNRSFFDLGVEVARLPSIFNTLPGGRHSASSIEGMRKNGVINFHYADNCGDGTKIIELHKQMDVADGIVGPV